MISLRLVSHTLALVVLITLANLGLLLALLLKPLHEPWSWSIACATAEWFWSYMQHHWERSLNAGAALQITGDEIPPGEPALVISNHLSYADYYLVQALAVRAGMLGRCRYFAKKELVWQVPVFGWSFWAVGMILVSRAWTADARLIEEAFARVKQNRHDVWIVLYPEGTRRTPKKVLEVGAIRRLRHDDSQPHRRERSSHRREEASHRREEASHRPDTPLTPRPKRSSAVPGGRSLTGFSPPDPKAFKRPSKVCGQPERLRLSPGIRDSHIKYIYDLTIQYTSPGRDAERVPSLAEELSCADLAAAGYRFRIHVDRIAIADLPQDDEALRHWLEERWERKDELLARMIREGQSGDAQAEHVAWDGQPNGYSSVKGG